MITVDELKKMFNVIEDQDLGPMFGRKKGAISAWRRDGVPAAIELKAMDLKKSPVAAVNGNSNHISITHVADQPEPYSPATGMLLDIISEWSEKKRRKLAAYAVSLNGDEEEEG